MRPNDHFRENNSSIPSRRLSFIRVSSLTVRAHNRHVHRKEHAVSTLGGKRTRRFSKSKHCAMAASPVIVHVSVCVLLTLFGRWLLGLDGILRRCLHLCPPHLRILDRCRHRNWLLSILTPMSASHTPNSPPNPAHRNTVLSVPTTPRPGQSTQE